MNITELRGHRAGEGWHLFPRRRVLLKVLGIMVAILLLVATFGSAGSTWLAWLFAPFWVGIGALPFLDRAPATDNHAVSRDDGLLLPVRAFSPRAIGVYLLTGVYFVAFALVALYAVFADQKYSFVIGFLLLGSIGAAFLWTAVVSIRQQRSGAGGIVVTPETIRLTNGRRDVWSVAWNDVTGIRPHWVRLAYGLPMPTDNVANYLQIQVPGWTGLAWLARFAMLDGPSIEVRNFAMDPHVALRILTYYFEHPDARAELASDAAVARAQSFAGQP